jgi:hypothetical protein
MDHATTQGVALQPAMLGQAFGNPSDAIREHDIVRRRGHAGPADRTFFQRGIYHLFPHLLNVCLLI